MNYCVEADVRGVARIFSTDYQVGTFKADDVNAAIIEASEQVRYLLMPNFDINVINAYSPNFPPAVVSLTKNKAANILFHRFLPLDGPQGDLLEDRLNKEIYKWECAVIGSTLLDSTGASVPAQLKPSIVIQGTPTSLQEQYSEGNRLFP